MIRCVVFDFDGTLVESNHIKRQTFFELASEFEDGLRVMKDVTREAADRDRYWIFARFVAALSVQADAKMLADRYTQACQERIASAPEISGAGASLERLWQEGKLLFVNSATPTEPLVRLIHLRQMERWFKGICGAPRRKHENLEIIRQEHDLRFDEILVVGDGESDRAAAEITGCHFVAVECRDNNFLHEPACLVPDLARLSEIVSSIS